MKYTVAIVTAIVSLIGFLLLLQLGITVGEEYIGVVPQ